VELVRDSSERRLVRAIGAIVFVDTMFYAAIAPLLPTLAHELHLSKLSAGVMTASYPIGTLVGALPGGVLAARAGPKFAVCAGLSLLAVSTLAFGLLHDAAALDAARIVEGVGGACSWAGGIAWVGAVAPPSRRGGLIGGALGAAIAGALLGPVVGTGASVIGRGPAFAAVVVLALGLIAEALRLPAPPAGEGQGLGELLAVVRRPAVIGAMWLTVLPAIVSGVLDVLGPLRLHRFGATAGAIGATFLVAAAAEGIVSPAVGRLSDRRGRLAPLRGGLAAATVVLLCFTLPAGPLGLALVIVAVAATLGLFWAPAMALLSDLAETLGLDQGLAAALMNLAWAGGQVVGSGAGGALAKSAGDGLPISLVAAMCAVTLLALVRAAPAPATSATSARRA
jgi:MFS family permease